MQNTFRMGVTRRDGDGQIIDVTIIDESERVASATAFHGQLGYTIQTNFSGLYENRIRIEDAVAAIFKELTGC